MLQFEARWCHSPLSACLCLSLSFCLSLCLSVSSILSVSLSVWVSIYLSLSVSVSSCPCLSICLSICLCVCISVCLSLSLSPSLSQFIRSQRTIGEAHGLLNYQEIFWQYIVKQIRNGLCRSDSWLQMCNNILEKCTDVDKTSAKRTGPN